MPLKIQELLQVPVWIFGCSLGIGTIILLLHLTMREEIITVLGFFYILVATLINGIALVVFVTLSYVYRQHQQEILLRASILLLNIPIAIGYAYLALSDFLK
jgi:hypothetical protein